MRLVLLGAPGSGKGTQAKTLGDYYDLKVVSLGDILREEVKKGTPLGKEVKKYMEEGVLVPDAIVDRIIDNNLEADFILDGYPRSIQQAERLDGLLKRKNLELDLAIYLEVNEKTVLRRLQFRRICVRCGANYHLINLPPKKEGICDECGAELVQRYDDHPAVIKERYQIFLNEIKDILSFYDRKNILKRILADGNKNEVFSKIKGIINNGAYSENR